MASQQDIAQALQKGGISVFGLKVEDRGGVVSLYGQVGTDADKQKAERVIMDTLKVKVANHITLQGGLASQANAPTGQTYTIKAGDTLSKIAQHFYGDASQWKRIQQANAAKIPNPDLIHPGTELVIPAK